MKIITEFVCSPNRKEIYDKNFIFLSNSIRDKLDSLGEVRDIALKIKEENRKHTKV